MSAAHAYRVNVPAELLRLGYALLRRLGKGSTAEVFEARHNPTGRRLAVKVSRADVPEAPLIVARMQTEWNVGRGLRHPHLVTTLDGGTFSDGRAWLAMELLIGHDLLHELETHGALEPRRAVHVIGQVCEGLQVLHRRGAVHRDIKPENVFLLANGRFRDHVKVIDLGILALPPDDPERAHEPTGHYILGTPLYLAPEQARGEPPDARTDLYAVGGVLYHMLTGRPPFESDDPTEVVSRHVNDPVPRVDTLVRGLPASLVALIHQCLEKDRDDRPPDAAAVMVALDTITQELVGVFGEEHSMRGAPLPGVPMAGHQGEWLRFGEDLGRLVALFWGAEVPPALRKAAVGVRRARGLLERARAESDRRREAADLDARHRIEHRDRLARRGRRITLGLGRMEARLREATGGVEEAAAVLASHDESYARLLGELRGVLGPTVQQTELRALAREEAAVDAALGERGRLTRALKAARELERTAAEALSELRAEQMDLRRGVADLDMEEQEDGFRGEQEAAGAADILANTMRGFERATLKLMLRYAMAIEANTNKGSAA